MAVLRDLVGGLTPTAVAGRDWYPVCPSGAASYVHVVLPPDDSGTTSTIGVGVLTPLPTGAGGDQAYAYFPIVLLTEGSDPQVVTGQRVGGQAYPIELGLTIGDSLEFVGDVDFTAAPSATLTLATTSPPTVVTTLSQLLDAKAVVDTVLGLPKVRGLLNTDLGPTTITVGGLLAAIGLLEPAGAGYQLASLSAFLDQTPLQIAEALFAGVLKMLASDEKPLVPIGAGGVWIFGEPAGTGVTDYGLRLQVPDVDVSPSGGPTVALQLGKFLSVDSAAGTWIKRSDPNATYPDPGVLLTLVREAGTTPAFRPRVDLVSLGVDVTGRDGATLVDVEGVRLGGVEPRILVSLDFADLTRVPWGAAARFDGLGIPLGDGLAAGVDNPVAQNLLSSGSGSSPGGDPQAVNPTFSATIGWITDPTVAGATLDVLLEQADGSPGGGGPVWLPVQHAFGPLQCRRVGVQWDDARRVLTFLFDGDVALSVLEVDLEGLSLGIPLQTPGQLGTYALGLQGLAVSYASGPLAISGGFIEDTGATPTEYEGEALIKAETWAIGALGAYATLDGHPSLFIFAVLDATLGGPPFFVVTGLCAGFGYNRSLRMPTQDQVPDFPLLAGIADPAAIGGPNPSPAQALAALEDWVRPAQGVDWFAAGVQFTSFELVQSNAVLVAVVGAGFEIAVLGISRIKLPQVGPQFAYAELGLEVRFDPTDGVLSASAVLTPNSYVIDPACHLTGGFAFDVWFAPESARGRLRRHPRRLPPRVHAAGVVPRRAAAGLLLAAQREPHDPGRRVLRADAVGRHGRRRAQRPVPRRQLPRVVPRARRLPLQLEAVLLHRLDRGQRRLLVQARPAVRQRHDQGRDRRRPRHPRAADRRPGARPPVDRLVHRLLRRRRAGRAGVRRVGRLPGAPAAERPAPEDGGGATPPGRRPGRRERPADQRREGADRRRPREARGRRLLAGPRRRRGLRHPDRLPADGGRPRRPGGAGEAHPAGDRLRLLRRGPPHGLQLRRLRHDGHAELPAPRRGHARDGGPARRVVREHDPAERAGGALGDAADPAQSQQQPAAAPRAVGRHAPEPADGPELPDTEPVDADRPAADPDGQPGPRPDRPGRLGLPAAVVRDARGRAPAAGVGDVAGDDREHDRDAGRRDDPHRRRRGAGGVRLRRRPRRADRLRWRPTRT